MRATARAASASIAAWWPDISTSGTAAPSGQALRPAEVRAIEETGREAVLLVRTGVAQDAGLQARQGVEQRQRRQLAAREDEVAEAQLEVDMGVDEALVDAFVAPAQQDRARRRPRIARPSPGAAARRPA